MSTERKLSELRPDEKVELNNPYSPKIYEVNLVSRVFQRVKIEEQDIADLEEFGSTLSEQDLRRIKASITIWNILVDSGKADEFPSIIASALIDSLCLSDRSLNPYELTVRQNLLTTAAFEMAAERMLLNGKTMPAL